MPANFADSTSVKWFFIPNGPNAGSISAFAVNSGSPDWLNVQGYGADPTGTNDSTTAFQSAINACTSTQGVVYVPGGSYVISSALIGNSNFAGLIGDGVHLSILKVPASSSTNSILTHASTPDGFKMKGLSFQGPGQTASGGQNGVTLSNSGGNVSDAIFEDLWFNGWPGYGFEVDSPIVSSFRNIRVLFSNKGLFINGGTSCSIISCYMNQITKCGYDIVGNGYSAFMSCAADFNGLSYLIRGGCESIAIVGSGHEVGTAYNLTVTNTVSNGTTATVTYSGPDQSSEFFTGMEVVVSGTSNGSGALNGRQTVTAVGTNTISFSSAASFSSAPDSGTASMYPGDGIAIADSNGTAIQGFYHHASAQSTSVCLYADGGSTATTIQGLVSVTGSGVAQTTDLYIATNTSNTLKLNNILVGNSVNNGTQVQTYSSGTWTVGALAENLSNVAAAGFIRMPKTGVIGYRNNGNTSDNQLAVNTTDQLEYNSSVIQSFGVGNAGFREDFISCGSNAAITTVASFPAESVWEAIQISGGTQSLVPTAGTFSNPGQLTFTTSASSGQGVALYKQGGSSSVAALGALGSNAGWQYDIIFQLASTSNICFRAGVCSAGQNAVDGPGNFIGVEYDTANASSNTDFTWKTTSATTSNYSTTNSKAADTSFHHVRIRSTSAGTILFSIDGGTETAVSTDVPTASMNVVVQLLTRTNSTASAIVDLVSYVAASGRT
jgi:hypothetical protein